jgi:hypothetical protein
MAPAARLTSWRRWLLARCRGYDGFSTQSLLLEKREISEGDLHRFEAQLFLAAGTWMFY